MEIHDLRKKVIESEPTEYEKLCNILQMNGSENHSIAEYLEFLTNSLKEEFLNLTPEMLGEILKKKVKRIYNAEYKDLNSKEEFLEVEKSILDLLKENMYNKDPLGWTKDEICEKVGITGKDFEKLMTGKGIEKYEVGPLLTNGKLRKIGKRRATKYVYFSHMNKMKEKWLKEGKAI